MLAHGILEGGHFCVGPWKMHRFPPSSLSQLEKGEAVKINAGYGKREKKGKFEIEWKS